MKANSIGTKTGRWSSVQQLKSNRPKSGAENTDEPLLFRGWGESGWPEGLEIVGMHLGPRTKASHPYNYDPLLQFKTDEEPDGCCYSDRLNHWYSYDVVRAKKLAHFGDEGDYFYRRSPESIQAFLRDLMGLPNLKLVRIEEHCNQANGFPCWYFAYQKGEGQSA